jgi:hypothetical protein
MDESHQTYRLLNEQVNAASGEWDAAVERAWVQLCGADPELTQLAVEALETPINAAMYFASRNAVFGELNCYAMLAAGERERVRHALAVIEHGIYT